MTHRSRPPGWFAARGGFSLVEVTLALGVVAFAVVSVLGVLPVALATSRTSVAQTRAAGLAQTVFADLRAGSFIAASPAPGLEAEGEPPLTPFDLSTLGVAGSPDTRTFYAVLTDTEPGGSGSSDPRRLHFTPDRTNMNKLLQNLQQAGAAASAYELSFTFNAQPDGFAGAGAANRVVLTIRPALGGQDTFRFATVIGKRGS